jgi:hypothetical protein
MRAACRGSRRLKTPPCDERDGWFGLQARPSWRCFPSTAASMITLFTAAASAATIPAADRALLGAVPFRYGNFMRRLSSFLSFLLSLAALAFIVAFVVHVFTTDTIALHRLADEAICRGQRSPCVPVFSLLERNLLGVTVAYDAPTRGVVRCCRPYLVVGEYACAVLPSTAVEQGALVAPPPRASAPSTARR